MKKALVKTKTNLKKNEKKIQIYTNNGQISYLNGCKVLILPDH